MRRQHYANERRRLYRQAVVALVICQIKNRIRAQREIEQISDEGCSCSVLGRLAPCSWCTDPAREKEFA